jgi:NhaP-type Na+/H+ or K+/H+ antiporter
MTLQSERYWVWGLLGLVVAAVCVSVLRSIGTFMALVRASHKLHNRMLGKHSLLKTYLQALCLSCFDVYTLWLHRVHHEVL